MRKIIRRRPLNLVESFELLEYRTVPAISIQSIVNGFDFVGSDSSVGPDGYKDFRINLIGLATDDVTSVRVEAKSGETVVYTWAYGANSNAFPLAEFIRVVDSSLTNYPFAIDRKSDPSASIYISPAPSTISFNSILVTVNYATHSPEPASLNVSTAAGETHDFMRKSEIFEGRTGVTGNDIPQYQADYAVLESSQYTGTSDSIKRYGDMHIKLLSLPSGKLFSEITKMYLDDGTGGANDSGNKSNMLKGSSVWSNDPTKGRYRLGFQESSDSSYKADIYAKPIRNLADAKLTLVIEFQDTITSVVTKIYTQFAGKTIDPTLSESNGVGWVNGTTQIYYVQPAPSPVNSSPVSVRYSTSKSTLSSVTPIPLYDLLRANPSGPIPDGSRIIFTPGEYYVTGPRKRPISGMKLTRFESGFFDSVFSDFSGFSNFGNLV